MESWNLIAIDLICEGDGVLITCQIRWGHRKLILNSLIVIGLRTSKTTMPLEIWKHVSDHGNLPRLGVVNGTHASCAAIAMSIDIQVIDASENPWNFALDFGSNLEPLGK